MTDPSSSRGHTVGSSTLHDSDDVRIASFPHLPRASVSFAAAVFACVRDALVAASGAPARSGASRPWSFVVRESALSDPSPVPALLADGLSREDAAFAAERFRALRRASPAACAPSSRAWTLVANLPGVPFGRAAALSDYASLALRLPFVRAGDDPRVLGAVRLSARAGPWRVPCLLYFASPPGVDCSAPERCSLDVVASVLLASDARLRSFLPGVSPVLEVPGAYALLGRRVCVAPVVARTRRAASVLCDGPRVASCAASVTARLRALSDSLPVGAIA